MNIYFVLPLSAQARLEAACPPYPPKAEKVGAIRRSVSILLCKRREENKYLPLFLELPDILPEALLTVDRIGSIFGIH